MYVRDARNNEEEWLLNLLEDNELDWQSFRSRDFKFVCSEDTNEILAVGRLTTHKTGPKTGWFELRSMYVTPEGKQVRAGVTLLSEFVEQLQDKGISRLYTVTQTPDRFTQYGFNIVDSDKLSDPLLNRVSQKADFLNEDDGAFSVLRLSVQEFATDSEISRDEVETERESQGFDEDHTHKYST